MTNVLKNFWEHIRPYYLNSVDILVKILVFPYVKQIQIWK